MKERKRDELQRLLQSNFTSDITSLLPHSIGHTDQYWNRVEGTTWGYEYQEVGTTGAILKVGPLTECYLPTPVPWPLALKIRLVGAPFGVELPDLTNKYTGCPVKFKFQINMNNFLV